MEDWINMTVQAPAPCSVDKQVIGCELIIKSYFLTLGAVGTVVMIAQVDNYFRIYRNILCYYSVNKLTLLLSYV